MSLFDSLMAQIERRHPSDFIAHENKANSSLNNTITGLHARTSTYLPSTERTFVCNVYVKYVVILFTPVEHVLAYSLVLMIRTYIIGHKIANC